MSDPTAPGAPVKATPIRIISDVSPLARSLARTLEARDQRVEIRDEHRSTTALYYPEGTDLDQLALILEAARPLLPTVHQRADLDCVELHLGDEQSLDTWSVRIYCDSEIFAKQVQSTLSEYDFEDVEVSISPQDTGLLKYGGASLFARQVIRRVLADHSVRVNEEKAWSSDDNDVWIYFPDPSYDGVDLKSSVPIEILGDDLASMLALQDHLKHAGYKRIEVRLLDSDAQPSFHLDHGPFRRDAGEQFVLEHSVRAFLHSQGLDAQRYPLTTASDSQNSVCAIHLPLGQWGRGELPPTGGAFPDRWQIHLRTDDPERVEPLAQRLLEAGYIHQKILPLPATSFGFLMRWQAAARIPQVSDFLQGELEKFIRELGPPAGLSLTTVEHSEPREAFIEIDLPTQYLDEPSLLARVARHTSAWETTLKIKAEDEYPRLIQQLRALNFEEFEVDTDNSVSQPEIRYGGAPPGLITYLVELIARETGHRCQPNHSWGSDDNDIWIFLPPPTERPLTETLLQSPDFSAWFATGPKLLTQRPLVQVHKDHVQIAHLTLPRRAAADTHLVPLPEHFQHYCLDQRTAETLVHVAESVLLAEPCLLEGETSVSKTSIVQYLAQLLGQPLVRINLNGQTDTGELVGRYLPQESAHQLPISVDELLEFPELLKPQSRAILERSRTEDRSLTRAEVQQVMASEQMNQHPWRWQDGLIISAMRNGWWVVLDELNLAEPQILERLNSVLERYPSIVLTENDHEVIGPGGHPVHPNFRIFATMNPAEYAGRSALSPAYRDRWLGYAAVPTPHEEDYHAMLRYLIWGQQPNVHIRGRLYSGAVNPTPLMPGLAKVHDMAPFLQSLARFHTSAERAVGQGVGGHARLGGRRKDRYVFTRRGLLSVLDYFNASLSTAAHDDLNLTARAALLRYYIGRLSTGADQQVMIQLLDAVGLGLNSWKLSLKLAEPSKA